MMTKWPIFGNLKLETTVQKILPGLKLLLKAAKIEKFFKSFDE